MQRVVTGLRDPNPRVDGLGVQIVRDAGIEVIEDVCAHEIRRQLAPWSVGGMKPLASRT